MMKCDMCYDRTSIGKRPMCATVCPSQALAFTTLEEIERTRRGTAINDWRFGDELVRTKVYVMVPPAVSHVDVPIGPSARGRTAGRPSIRRRRRAPGGRHDGSDRAALARGLPRPLGRGPLRHPPRAGQVPDARLGAAGRAPTRLIALLGRRRDVASGSPCAIAARSASRARRLAALPLSDRRRYPCILVRTRRRHARAPSRRCARTCRARSCTEPETNELFCPCHHGVFSVADGRPVAGPPTRPSAADRWSSSAATRSCDRHRGVALWKRAQQGPTLMSALSSFIAIAGRDPAVAASRRPSRRCSAASRRCWCRRRSPRSRCSCSTVACSGTSSRFDRRLRAGAAWLSGDAALDLLEPRGPRGLARAPPADASARRASRAPGLGGVHVRQRVHHHRAARRASAMVTRTPFIFPSLGPTAFLLFFTPQRADRQPAPHDLGPRDRDRLRLRRAAGSFGLAARAAGAW